MNCTPCRAATSENVYIIGEQVKIVTMSLIGLWANTCLDSISIDTAFLGTNGFQNFSGPCSDSFQDAEIKKKILERSKKSITLADSSKCKSNALAQFAMWKEIDYLIMDTPAEMDRIKQIEESTNVVLV
ncbi:MAG: hypothetical protein LBB68_09740 [Treponema sp.]|nr:hypothetical protein [Treponema sp.]